MAYDEYFHYGKIQLYAHQWLPFFSSVPDGSTVYGAVARDPSYLYHYLLSFPFRLFAHFVHSFTAQVVFLRLFDIGFLATGLVLFWKAFIRAGISKLVVNLTMFIMVFLPVVPFLAGQINYDNLLFMMTALSVWLMVRLTQEVRETRVVPAGLFLSFASVLLLGGLVKYAFLPFILGASLFWILFIHRSSRQFKIPFWRLVLPDLGTLRSVSGVFVVILFVVSFGLFSERYIGNTMLYHTPTPECDTVLGVEPCRDYDPFARNQNYKELNLKDTVESAAKRDYPVMWGRNIMRSLFFTVGPRELQYPAGEPLKLAYIAAWIGVAAAAAALLARGRKLWCENSVFPLFFIASGFYVVVLFAQNLSDFLALGVPVAVQGRYIVLILPLLLILAISAIRDVTRRLPHRQLVIGGIALLLAIALVFEGGGLAPFVIRSSDEWMWAGSFMQHANHVIRDVAWPLIIR